MNHINFLFHHNLLLKEIHNYSLDYLRSNIPLFLIAGYKIGKGFFVKSLIGVISMSIFIDILDIITPITNDKVLACIYGGILTGIGTALILKSQSSTGGSELLTSLIKRFKSTVQMGRILVIIDAVIVFLNVVFLGNIEIGLYSAITIYIMGVMIDIIYWKIK